MRIINGRLLLFSYIFLLLPSLFSTNASALNEEGKLIEKVVINGNKLISDASVHKYLKLDYSSKYNQERLDETLKRLHKKQLFSDIHFSLEGNLLKIELIEKPRYSRGHH